MIQSLRNVCAGMVVVMMGVGGGASAWGAGEGALKPMPAAFEASERAEFAAVRAAIGGVEGQRLVGRVSYVQDGKARWLYVVEPEGRVAVGEAAELEVVSGPGLPTTAVALSRVVVGFDGPREELAARAFFEGLGLRGEARRLEGTKHGFVLETASALESFEAAERIKGAGGVSYAHPDFIPALTTASGDVQRPRANPRGSRVEEPVPGRAATLQVIGPAPANAVIPNGGNYDFGSTAVGTSVQVTFQVKNTGTTPLTLNEVTVPAGFTVVQQPLSPVPTTAMTPMIIQLDATAAGTLMGPLTFSSNDPANSPYTMTIKGVVTGGGGTPGVQDPLFGTQWHLSNTGQNGGLVGQDVNVLPAWALQPSLGAAATVAVMDDGSQPDHPDYVDNVQNVAINNYFVATDANSGGSGSHGTAVAGLVAARDNNLGVRGAAPRAKLILTNSFRKAASTSPSTTEVATYMTQAVAAGAMVHTNSWGFVDPTFLPDVIRDAIVAGYTTGRGGLGTLFLFAAANGVFVTSQNTSIGVPVQYGNSLASLPQVVAVGSSSNLGKHALYGNYGPKVELTGPSSGGRNGNLRIATTDVTGNPGYVRSASPAGDYTPNIGTGSFGGTSAATPIVAGVAALVFAENASLSAAQVRRILQKTARRDMVIDTSYPFLTLSRRSDSFGYGLVDANAAVLAARASVATNNLTWPAPPTSLSSSRTPTTTRINWTNPATGAAGEYSRAVVVRYTAGVNNWLPVDGATYTDGMTPSAGVKVMKVGDVTSFVDSEVGTSGNVVYAVFAVNEAKRYSFPAVLPVFPIEPAVVLFDTMETPNEGATGWQAGGDWTRAVPTFAIGTTLQLNTPYSGARCYLTNASGMYSGAPAVHQLLSPEIDLKLTNSVFNGQQPVSVSVTWWEMLDTWGHGFDVTKVEVLDTESTSENPVIRTLQVQTDSLSYGWRQRWFDLRNQLGKKIRIRWTLSTTLDFGLSGWYLDDLRVGATLSGTPPFVPGRPRRITLPIPFGEIEFGGPGRGVAGVEEGVTFVMEDVAALLRGYGTSVGGAGYRGEVDLNGDGTIGFADLVLMLDGMCGREGSADR